MKNSRILFALFVLLSIALSSNGAEKGYQKILGKWDFSAPNAPQPYDSGVLTLKETDQKLGAEFTIQGQAMTVPKTEFEAEILTLYFTVENTPITLKFKIKDGILDGSTETPNGTIIVTAKPSKK